MIVSPGAASRMALRNDPAPESFVLKTGKKPACATDAARKEAQRSCARSNRDFIGKHLPPLVQTHGRLHNPRERKLGVVLQNA